MNTRHSRVIHHEPRRADKAALPWPLPDTGEGDSALSGTAAWLAEQWTAVLGLRPVDERADFFELGGGSLAAAQLVSRIRVRAAEFTMSDVYDLPRLGKMAEAIGEEEHATGATNYSSASPTPPLMQWVQSLSAAALFVLAGARWVTWLLAASWLLGLVSGFEFLPSAPEWVIVTGLVLFVTPFGRMAIAAAAARLLLLGVRPGDYPRGGSVHIRLWLADQIALQIDPVGLAGAPWVTYYARALGAKIGRDVDLHTLPPVTGMLEIGSGVAIEPEVDLTGTWIDGDTVRIGSVRIGADATIGARSTLAPGAKIGRGAEVRPGSAVFGRVKAGQSWSGSPAARAGAAPKPLSASRPPSRTRWLWAYAASSVGLSLLPFIAFAAGAAVLAAAMRGSDSFAEAVPRALIWLVPGVIVAGVVFAGAVVLLVRLLSIGLEPGTYPVRSRVAWQAWTTERLLDASRTLLFPIYSSLFTPVWLRLLGARVGHDVEASTVLLLPSLTRIDEGAFLADDTMVATYELRGGWMRLARARIGKRAFLGNSGLSAAGHTVPKNALVAVLSVAPAKAKAGSSWLGSPAVRLRRVVSEADLERTYKPTRALRVARAVGAVPHRPGRRDVRARTRRHVGARRDDRFVGHPHRLPALGRRDDARRGGRRARDHGREMGLRRADPRRRAPAVVEFRVADRGLRHVHGDARGAMVRERRRRHARARGLVEDSRREDRPRRVDRQLLAARARPGDAR